MNKKEHRSQSNKPDPAYVKRLLDGFWRGDDLTLRIDADRGLASVEDVGWVKFEVLDIQRSMVVFDVGATRFVGLFRGEEEIGLTKVGFLREYLLRRLRG